MVSVDRKGETPEGSFGSPGWTGYVKDFSPDSFIKCTRLKYTFEVHRNFKGTSEEISSNRTRVSQEIYKVGGQWVPYKTWDCQRLHKDGNVLLLR